MEKIAIVSDIHANLTAWNTFLEDTRKKGINRIFCLGDLVYKGCSPKEVIDSVRQSCEVVVKGNCDEYIASNEALNRKFWTRLQIGEERANYLGNLPTYFDFEMSGYFIRIYHASSTGLLGVYNPMFNNESSRYASSEIKEPDILFQNTEWLRKQK